MRGSEIERELERLAVGTQAARARLAEIRRQLSRARSIVDEARRLLGEDERRVGPEGTPGAGHAQGEAP